MASVEFALNIENKRYSSAYLGLKALANNLNKATDSLGVPLSAELRRFLQKSMNDLSMKHSTPWPGGTTSSTLSKRSGGFARALKDASSVTGSKLSDVRGQIAIPKEMVIHETGGTVSAKKAKYLTIPLKAALNANGTPIKQKARDWPNTFVAESKKGNLLIFQRRGKEVVPLYVLKKSVHIPPRLGLVKNVEGQMPAFIDKLFEALVSEIMKV